MSFDELTAARTADGTDEDAILIDEMCGETASGNVF